MYEINPLSWGLNLDQRVTKIIRTRNIHSLFIGNPDSSCQKHMPDQFWGRCCLVHWFIKSGPESDHAKIILNCSSWHFLILIFHEKLQANGFWEVCFQSCINRKCKHIFHIFWSAEGVALVAITNHWISSDKNALKNIKHVKIQYFWGRNNWDGRMNFLSLCHLPNLCFSFTSLNP